MVGEISMSFVCHCRPLDRGRRAELVGDVDLDGIARPDHHELGFLWCRRSAR
jgi:hypothetical protein